jgi:glycosyltransferase involved in cell wall biosynthesis
MKQLVAIHYPVFGGPANVVLRLHPGFRAHGWDTTVVLPSEPGDTVKRFGEAGISTVQIPLHRLRQSANPAVHIGLAANFLKDVSKLRELIRAHRPDVAVVSGLVNPHLAMAAAREHVPVIWQMTDNVVPSPVRQLLMHYVLRVSTVIMFDGETLARLYLGGLTTRCPVVVYFPPVNCALFIPSRERREESRKALGIPLSASVVGTVANISPVKGLIDFVRASSIIFRSQPNSWFLVVGAPFPTHLDYLQQLRDEVERSGVPVDRFIFTGAKTDVERYYPAMDVKVIASHSESTTTTAMEAMACGVPVVATDVGGLREVVKAGTTGLLVSPRDPAGLAAATLRILNDPGEAQRMGQQARQIAESKFDVARCLQSHIEAYDAALAAARQDHRPESPGLHRGG